MKLFNFGQVRFVFVGRGEPDVIALVTPLQFADADESRQVLPRLLNPVVPQALSVELKEAWDELKGLWAWRQWFSNGLETSVVRGPGSGSPVMASIGAGLVLPLAGVDSRNIPGFEPEEPFAIPPVDGQARGPPAGQLNSDHLGQQIGFSELVSNGPLSDERCAA